MIDLQKSYLEYVEKYQNGDFGWVCSFQYADLVRFILEKKYSNKCNLLDLGSGFTSFVSNSLNQGFNVSVDDEPIFLEKTKSFLSENFLFNKDVRLWENVRQDVLLNGSFDLILVDGPGNCRNRMINFDRILEFGKSGSIFVIDDAHGQDLWPDNSDVGYLKFLLNKLTSIGRVQTLETETKDGFGRYSILFYKS